MGFTNRVEVVKDLSFEEKVKLLPGIEPGSLFLTKEALYLLSYSSVTTGESYHVL